MTGRLGFHPAGEKQIPMKSMKRSTLSLAAIVAALSAPAGAAITTVPVTGWNHDIVINHPGPFNESVTGTMDNGPGNVENWTWVAAGDYLFQTELTPTPFAGLVAGSHTSAGPSGAEFTFQDFSGNNALFLIAGQSGTLSLNNAALYSTLVFIGAAANGAATSVTLTLNFSDSTSAVFSSSGGITRDWFDGGSPETAYLVGGRASNRGDEGYTSLFRQTNGDIRLHEYVIGLSPEDQAKELVSIDVLNTGSGTGRLALFAVSGEVVPEPSTMGLVALCGLLGLGRRRR